jgi:hypothetical protein
MPFAIAALGRSRQCRDKKRWQERSCSWESPVHGGEVA